MIGILIIGAVLASCLLASMYITGGMVNRNWDCRGIEKRQKESISMLPSSVPCEINSKIEASDLEKMTLSELPEMLDKKPAGILGELYVKKEVYVRKDLAEK